jgi:hypothetical protein
MTHTDHRFLLRDEDKDEKRQKADTVELCYSREELMSRAVVRNTSTRMYSVFESQEAMWAHVEATPLAKRFFEEVIIGSFPQRLKFDIDAPSAKVDQVPWTDLRPESAVPCPSDSELCDLFGLPAPCVSREAELEADRRQKMLAILALLRDAIVEELYCVYFAVDDIAPSPRDLVVCDASGRTAAGTYKYSYHVLVPSYAVVDNNEAGEFTQRVLRRLPPVLAALRLVDPGINSRVQNFRLVGSCKTGDDRRLEQSDALARELGTGACAPLDTLVVAPVGMRVLSRVLTDVEALAVRGKSSDLSEEALQRVMLAAAAAVRGHNLRETRMSPHGGTMLIFDRDLATMCLLCNEVHHHDNTLMLLIEPIETAGGTTPARLPGAEAPFALTELCRHCPGKSRAAGQVLLGAARASGAVVARVARGVPDLRAAGDMNSRVTKRLAGIADGSVDPHAESCASGFERLPAAQQHVYDAPTLRPYELVPTLAVRAPMKMGKTKAMRQFLDRHYPPDALRPATIRIVTFRQTFSNSLKESYPEFALYNEVSGDLDSIRCPRLIVQVESLHRIPMPAMPEPVDLLILDESESILAQFSSNLHKHFVPAFAMFQWMLHTARRVVCLDANLGDRTLHTLQRMRPNHPVHFHWNRHTGRAEDDQYFFTADHAAWLDRLHRAVRDDMHVVVASSSLGEAETIESVLRREFPDLRIGLYSSKTPAAEKTRHFGDVHTYWSELDVLIYTPTVTAGVSYELPHFDVLFGYFTDASCEVETCRQMLGRVRCLSLREHYICLQGVRRSLPETAEKIASLVRCQRAGLYRTVDDAALQFSYTPNGDIVYYESDYFYLWVETRRMVNLSQNSFIERFVDQVAEGGAQVALLDPPDDAPSSAAVLAAHKAERLKMREDHCAAVAEAAVFSAAEALRVRDLMTQQADVSPAEVLALERWQLAETYAWHGRPVDAGFVQDYSDPAARRVYRNLMQITAAPSLSRALRDMGEREAAHYEFTMEQRFAGVPTAWAARVRKDPSLALLAEKLSASAVEGRDLLHERQTYVSQAHHLAVWLMQVCGFRCISDARQVHAGTLEARIRAALAELVEALDLIVFTFRVRRVNLLAVARATADRALFLSRALMFINSVLRGMYGVEIKKTSTHSATFVLRRTAVSLRFTISPVADPDDPLPHIPSQLEPLPEPNPVEYFLELSYSQPLSALGIPDGHHADHLRDSNPDDVDFNPDAAPLYDSMGADIVNSDEFTNEPSELPNMSDWLDDMHYDEPDIATTREEISDFMSRMLV